MKFFSLKNTRLLCAIQDSLARKQYRIREKGFGYHRYCTGMGTFSLVSSNVKKPKAV
jgi:hypothetical protein